MTAMTVLPSFQTFLQSTTQTARPLSPLLVHTTSANQQYERQQAIQPHSVDTPRSPSADERFIPVFPSRLSPSIWKVGAMSLSSSSMSSPQTSSSSEEDDDEDDDDELHNDQFMLQHERARAASFLHRRRLDDALSPYRYSGAPMTPSLAAASPLSEASAAAKRVKKKYLKERERCEIVRRVRAGEKQAHLAKEFGVSRAAVCYLLKHQMEILRRSAQRL